MVDMTDCFQCVPNRWVDEVDYWVLAIMRVLDTAALLYWPADQIIDGVCATSQLVELERVSSQRFLLISSLDADWREVDVNALQTARNYAAESGDLPRLSNVDLDVLALAINLELPLYTDDYRLQNVMQSCGLTYHSVGTPGMQKVWRWELHCSGCRVKQAVPNDASTSKQGPVKDCDVCGSPMYLKRGKK